jgi:hypothetical protein
MDGQGLKALTRTREPKFGHFIVEFATPGIGHILKSAGCGFALFDMEHSGFGWRPLRRDPLLRGGILPAIVRFHQGISSHRRASIGAEGLC